MTTSLVTQDIHQRQLAPKEHQHQGSAACDKISYDIMIASARGYLKDKLPFKDNLL